MASGNTQQPPAQAPGSASGNTLPQRGPLPEPYTEILDDYTTALEGSPLGSAARRKYRSRVRAYLAWLAAAPRPGRSAGIR